MFSRRGLTGFAFVAMLLLCVVNVHGQEVNTAIVIGTVQDSTRAAIRRAVITLTHVDTDAITTLNRTIVVNTARLHFDWASTASR